MTRSCFEKLLNKLKSVGYERSRFVGEKEMLFVFLLALFGHSNRDVQERFQRSGDTISKVIHYVANMILKLKPNYISHPQEVIQTPTNISHDDRFYPFFKNCIGALDGTFINASVPVQHERSFRNRKGFISQNVLGVCSFEMDFFYVLAGWEGSAHDSRVLESAYEKGFSVPDRKYYLADAGYSLSKNTMTPYRGVRYHLKEWRRGIGRPQNMKELFNFRHSSLRNVIERTFGVLKNRFPILKSMTSYDYDFQVKLTICTFVLHNFLRINLEPEDFENGYEDDEDDDDDEMDEDEVEDCTFDLHDNSEMASRRDRIASAMWEDYQSYIQENNL
eukprot:CAMPEP_0182451530 /NCGR_PEP_ID=MMETSP1172-20130603/43771_1 /TAXON_ID=708627 /ORGANISM="Timspurckia oligopyrenoides, Strain CCMP3278" /LENGTH=332 /DNA_ID=CAMNT_0024649313 /DNA_START=216 /DNA_END=1214 /DNA_ORIENTATION=+